MQIAIFGGSFDPPHIGHEAIINEASKSLDVQKVLIIPTFLNPFKDKSLIEPRKRLALIEKLFIDNDKIEICDFEVNQNRPVNTNETVNYILKKYNPSKVYLIIGADNYKTIHTWTNYDKLKEKVEFVVAKRHCVNEEIIGVKLLDINIDISSTSLRNSLNLDYIPKKIQKDVKNIWQVKG